MPQRGDRVAPPRRPGEWELRFVDNAAADGWEKLCGNVPTGALSCWDALTSDPVTYSRRQKPLHDEFSSRAVGGRALPQWQLEVTGSGRVWYCPDVERRIVWLTKVSIGHPSQTDRRQGAR